jgi:hypothetical protein
MCHRMLLNALLVADAVSAPPDGKFYIHGGGLTRLTVPSLPFPIPQLGIFVRLEIEEAEVGRTYEFRFKLTDPDDVSVGVLPQFEAPLPATPVPLEDGEQRFAVLGMNIAGIMVGRAGLHRLTFAVDGEPLAVVPLPVVVLTDEQLRAQIRPPQSSLPPRPNRAARRHPPRRPNR